MEAIIRFCETQQVADDTHVIRQLAGEGVNPVATYVNSMVITGAEPVIVDTGVAISRSGWLERVFSLVEPEDVRWIFLSHDDSDHTGNLMEVLDRCPNATLVANWFTVERMAGEVLLPLDRMRWVNGGESFDAGDRELVAVVPPTFDSPTTRGLYDTKTGVYWAADSFALPVPHEVEGIRELPPGMFREAFQAAQRMVSPWLQWLDPDKYQEHLDAVAAIAPSVITSCHGVALRGDEIASSYELLRELPYLPPFAWPVQQDLELLLKSLAAAPAA
jgi:flavorubredoxin